MAIHTVDVTYWEDEDMSVLTAIRRRMLTAIETAV